MKQTFTKYNAKNTNSSGRAVLRQGTLRRPDAVPPTSRSICHVRRVPVFVVIFALCCISCRNVIEAPDEPAEIAESGGGEGATGKLYTLSGAVGAGGAVPSSLAANSRGAFFSDTGGGIGNTVCGEADTADGRVAAANARSATYSPVDGSVISYTVTATNTADSAKSPEPLELAPGETTFEIKLVEGTYTLSVEGFLTEGDGKKKILYGEAKNTVTVNDTTPNPPAGTIYVNPIFDEGGTGTVSLKMNLSGCKIKSVKAVWKKQGSDGTGKTATFDKDGSDLTTIYFCGSESESEEPAFAFSESESTADVPVGFYTVDFYFYNDAAVQDGSTMVFSCFQAVSVYQHLTTDFWRNNGGSSYISDGKFTLTAEILKGYARHLFYVHPEEKDTTLNEGTWYAPFDSVRTAVKKICAINDGNPYTVILLSDDEDESTTSYTSGNKAYIDIAPNTSLPLAVTILGKDGDDNDTLRTINAALTADRTGSVMYIGENAAVTLKNIHITGGYSSYNTGSGIINKGTLTMEDCTVSGCIATHCGGGGIGNFGTLSMNTCTVSGCTAEISGGAIFSNGTLTVKDCTISSCEADWGGGGISNGKTGTLTVIGGSISLCKGGSSSGGGGIYSQGTLTVTGCTISGNESYNGGGIRSDVSDASVTVSITDCEITCSMTGGKGGGISNKGPLTVTGCTIICDGTSGTSGLGIYNEGGTADIPVTVTDCTISGRKRVAYGGGIYNTGTLIVTGGTISSCEATKGGGIWNGGTLTVSGTSISSCKATGYSDSCGGAIFSNGGETAAVLTVEGSTKITGCTALKIGGGVYILNSTFTISGSASIPSETKAAKDNDVFLASGKTITVKGTLTAESPVATISLDDGEYTADRQVLQAPDGGAITPDICEKFAVAQDPNGIEWKVTPDGTGTKGVLRNSTLYVRGAGAGWYTENPDYTASAGSDSNSGSKSAPFATIRKALTVVKSMNDGTSEYTIYVDGTITDSAAGANGMGDISPANALNLKIQSMSATTNATLDAQNNGRVLNINANAAVTLKNVNIANGTTADNGGGIYNEGSLTIDGGAITNCTANTSTSSGGDGGGICNNVTDASITCTIIDCTITGCKATGSSSFDGNGGGIYNKAGTLRLTNVNITGGGDIANPDAKNNGGGICNAGTLTIEGGKIKDCVSRCAGGIININGTLTCTGVTVENCIAQAREGGGIYNYFTNSTGASPAIATLTDCTISGCKTLATEYIDYRDGGGGIKNDSGILTLSGGKITGCSSIEGGGIFIIGGELVITDGAEISGNKAEGATVEASNCGGGIKIDGGNVTLENGTISDNEAVWCGGGVYVDGKGKFTLNGGEIRGNAAKSGGGIGIWTQSIADNVTITGGTISDNTASEYGGGVYNLGTLIQNGGEISNNTASSGGGVYNSNTYVWPNGTTSNTFIGKFTMSGGTISSNTTTGNGGGVYVSGGTFEMSGGTITSNTATTDETVTPNGGGVCFESGSFTMSGGEISDNTAKGAGGGVYFKGTAFTMSGTAKINGNTVTYASGGHGGGVSLKSGTFTIEGGEISGNTSTGTGGGVYSSDTLIMKGGTVSGNTATTDGGGVYVNSGTAEMSGTAEISGNEATSGGGGVYVNTGGTFKMSGTVKISDCKTTSTTSGTGGGGIYSLGTLNITDGTISGCIAGRSGGGIYAYDGTVETCSNVTFSGCEATGTGSVGSGGGICINSGVTVNVKGCTFESCKAGASGGGIWNKGTLSVSYCTVENCSANNNGGGICNAGGTVGQTLGMAYIGCTPNDTSGF